MNVSRRFANILVVVRAPSLGWLKPIGEAEWPSSAAQCRPQQGKSHELHRSIKCLKMKNVECTKSMQGHLPMKHA